MTRDRWSQMSRIELVTLGKDLVTERLERLGCTVSRASNPMDGRLEVRTTSGRSLEVFVSTQRVGGYAFWTKRRLRPEQHRFAALVLLGESPEPALYTVPSEEWLDARPPLTNRDYRGKQSEPEYGIEIGPSSLASLRRYAWTGERARDDFS
jgi:hypothetical protein